MESKWFTCKMSTYLLRKEKQTTALHFQSTYALHVVLIEKKWFTCKMRERWENRYGHYLQRNEKIWKRWTTKLIKIAQYAIMNTASYRWVTGTLTHTQKQLISQWRWMTSSMLKKFPMKPMLKKCNSFYTRACWKTCPYY